MSVRTLRKPQVWGCPTCSCRVPETTTVPLYGAGHLCPNTQKWSDFKVVK